MQFPTTASENTTNISLQNCAEGHVHQFLS